MRAAVRQRAAALGAALLVLVPAGPVAVAAQEAAGGASRDSIAFASPRGTYVWMKGTVVSPAHPVAGVVAHRLERAHLGGKWGTVADVSAVPDGPSFFGRLDSLTRRAVVRALRQKDESAAWDYIVRFPRADSLAAILGNDDVRLALGIYGLDPSPKNGETWRYRVSDVDAHGAASNPVISNPVSYPPRVRFDPVSVARSREGDSVTVVWWYVGARGTRAKTVEVWRRRGRSGAFVKVDSVAISILAGDSLLARSEDRDVVPGAMYQYYAVPRDLFFNRGSPSDTVTLFTAPLAGALLPDSIVARGVDTAGIVLTWSVARPERIRTIQVFRSSAQDTGFVQIAELPPTAERFLDVQVEPMHMYYYRLGMTGLRGTVSARTATVFGFFRPALPPAPPQAVRTETTTGAFRIRWASGGEANLAGYRVYRTDAPIDSLSDSTAMQLVSPLLPPTDSVFVDSSADLGAGRRYTWAVRAIGVGGLASGYSNPASASRTVEPSLPTPSGLSAYADTRGIVLGWTDATGIDPLVNGYLVLRRDAVSRRESTAHGGGAAGVRAGQPGAWDTITARPLGRDENRYRDTTALRGAWEYEVVAVGVTGRQSEPSPPVRVSRTPAPPLPPGGFRAEADSAGILLAWDPVADSTAMVRVYRYERGSQPSRIAQVPAADLGYHDGSARPGLRYYYYLTTLSKGVEGPRSEERTVRR